MCERWGDQDGCVRGWQEVFEFFALGMAGWRYMHGIIGVGVGCLGSSPTLIFHSASMDGRLEGLSCLETGCTRCVASFLSRRIDTPINTYFQIRAQGRDGRRSGLTWGGVIAGRTRRR